MTTLINNFNFSLANKILCEADSLVLEYLCIKFKLTIISAILIYSLIIINYKIIWNGSWFLKMLSKF